MRPTAPQPGPTLLLLLLLLLHPALVAQPYLSSHPAQTLLVKGNIFFFVASDEINIQQQ